MGTDIPPTPRALEEALDLSAEILGDIELSRVPLVTAALKAGRLARLLNDFEAQQLFLYEVSGYPTTAKGIAPEVWSCLKAAGRIFEEKASSKEKSPKEVAFLESIEQLEQMLETARLGLQVAQDPDVSITSANPNQVVSPGFGNTGERGRLHAQISRASKRIGSRRSFLHRFAYTRYYELKFSGIAQDVFSAVRESVDRQIGDTVPGAAQKFASVHDNLRSENPEDWSNAVHSCRRILQDLADAVFPPTGEERTTSDGRKIKLGSDNYINRLMCFAEDKSESARFVEIVGSHLRFLGDRLDAIFKAAQKGSHAVVTQEEANRYVVFTYMLVGDVLSLPTEISDDDASVQPSQGD